MTGIDRCERAMGTIQHREIKQRSVIANIARSVRLDGGENLILIYDSQLDEDTLERWSGGASDEGAEGNGNEAQRNRNPPVTAVDPGHLEGPTTDEHDEDLNTNFCKSTINLKTL